MADFLLALAEFDLRRCWVELGHASLFDYLHRGLGLAKGTAFYRKTAAELIRRFPEVLDALRQGKLCVTTVVEVARVLTAENRAEVLPRFFGLSKHEAKLVSAELAPRPDVPKLAVVVPIRRAGPDAAPPTGPGPIPLPEVRQVFQPVEPMTSVESRPPSTASAPLKPTPPSEDSAEPFTADRSRLHVTVSRAFLEKLEAARLALSHARPAATVEEVLEAGLDRVLATDARKRAPLGKPRSAHAARESLPHDPGHVPAHVFRAVWTRDQGRCQRPLANGDVCGSRYRPEFDHIQPRALGGETTVENGRILCRRHDDLAARCAFGDALMDRYTRRSGENAR